MPARVIVTVVDGPMKGSKFRFDERMVCIVGRAENCALLIPPNAAAAISRHHCLLDIDPPFASIQDLGSKFGTRLNGEEIGSVASASSSSSTNSTNSQLPSRKLRNRDVFSIGTMSFLVELRPGAKCEICGRDIPEKDETDAIQPDGSALCRSCVEASRSPAASHAPGAAAARTSRLAVCAICGQSVQLVEEPKKGVEILCPKCQRNKAAMSTCALSLAEIERRDSSQLHIEGFTVTKLLGRGGMGAVYLATRHEDGDFVALKVMLPGIAFDEKARDEFLREAKNSINLKHPNIVEGKCAGYSGGALYLALEYMPGGSLKRLLEKRGVPMEPAEACPIALQMLDALDYAHNAKLESVTLSDGVEGSATGLVHRDIKPENIFLKGEAPRWIAKIADFGLAKAFSTAGLSGCTLTGDFCGTLGFIPKQQVLNFKYVKPEVDVWAAAATLYWMLTLHTPRIFGNDPFESLAKSKPVPILCRRPDVSSKLAALLDLALDDSSRLAFKTAAQFKAALQEAFCS